MFDPAASQFQRYVDRASEGRTELWRLLVGWPAILILTLFTWILVFGFIYFVLSLLYPDDFSLAQPELSLNSKIQSPSGVAFQLIAVAIGLFWTWLVLKFLHRRRFSGLLGAGGRISWHNFHKGTVAALIAGLMGEVVNALIDPSLHRAPIALGEWLLWLAPLLLLLFCQIAAEEVLFRGYVLQSLAVRFPSPVMWAVLPSTIFVLIHWDSRMTGALTALHLGSIAVFAFSAVLLVRLTGDLGAPMGLHFGTNIGAILLVSHMPELGGAALMQGRLLQSSDWTSIAMVGVTLNTGISAGLALALLVLSRSPLQIIRAPGGGAAR